MGDIKIGRAGYMVEREGGGRGRERGGRRGREREIERERDFRADLGARRSNNYYRRRIN